MFHAGSDTTSDILNLLVTGVLNQESRLQEVERKVANLGTTQGGIQTWRGPTALSQQTLDLETRVSHLEEDLRDYKWTTHHQLEVVRTELKELQRKESEDMRGMHKELSDDVEDLDGKVNNDVCLLSLGTVMFSRKFLTTTRTNFNFVVVGTEPTEELLQLVYAGR